MKRVTQILIGLILIATLVYTFNQERIINTVIERVVETNFTTTLLDSTPDGLHVVLCGAGSPLPDPKRSGPCTAVIAGNQVYIVDSGAGSTENLALFRIPQGLVNGVFLTHFHSDHIDGLGELILQRWVNAFQDSPLPVYGPDGVEDIVYGLEQSYRQDTSYRIAHHGVDTLNPEAAHATAMPFTLPMIGEQKLILEKDGLKVSSFVVEHEPVHPGVGYRFDYKGRSVVISGDTTKSDNLQALSQDVDLLVHEALNFEMVGILTTAAENANRPRMVKITKDILDYHTSPTEAAEIARDANVGYLLFNHIVPSLPFKPMEKIFTKGVSDIYSGPFTVGSDGTMISLEADKKTIELKHAGSFM